MMIQLAKKISKAEQKPVRKCGKNISKTRSRHWRRRWKACCQPGWHLVSQFVVANLCRRNGFQHRWRKNFAKDAGRALLERGLAFSGPMECCGFTHNVKRLEHSREERVAWRALFSSSLRRSPSLLQRQWIFSHCSCGDTV